MPLEGHLVFPGGSKASERRQRSRNVPPVGICDAQRVAKKRTTDKARTFELCIVLTQANANAREIA